MTKLYFPNGESFTPHPTKLKEMLKKGFTLTDPKKSKPQPKKEDKK